MKLIITWSLIFYATLKLVASTDIGSVISTTHCRSMCLQKHTNDGKCWVNNREPIRNVECEMCWIYCGILGQYDKIKRQLECKMDIKNSFSVYSLMNLERLNISSKIVQSLNKYPGCTTACSFYEKRGSEEDKYEPSKLPAPEKSDKVVMKRNDVAVLLQRDHQGIWKEQSFYTAEKPPALMVAEWIIVASEDGTFKHYSWDKWYPKVSQLTICDPLVQADIAWLNWRNQLKEQRTKVNSTDVTLQYELRVWSMKELNSKPSFIVIWQELTGIGITGNQVTDSESTQISFPRGNKYIVRITTNDGPGSQSIIIDTTSKTKSFLETIFEDKKFMQDLQELTFLMIAILSATICAYITLAKISKYEKALDKKIKNLVQYVEDKTKEMQTMETSLTSLTNPENMETNLTKQKAVMANKVVTLCYPYLKTTQNTVLRKNNDHVIEVIVMGMNENAENQDANSQTVNMNSQVATLYPQIGHINSQDENMNTRVENMNMHTLQTTSTIQHI